MRQEYENFINVHNHIGFTIKKWSLNNYVITMIAVLMISFNFSTQITFIFLSYLQFVIHLRNALYFYQLR